ncbi:hypothetical protein OA009_01480 [Paracoccaceae bacterium]|nr:hypothetical protein [Paracoccaceae bacterium]
MKKNSDEPKTLGFHFKYALMLALVSLALSALALGSLYFIFFVEINNLKSELNSKLNKNTFLSEREKIVSSSIKELQSEKEFLLSRIDMVNKLVKENVKDIESKISAAISENMKSKSKDEAQNQSDIKNEGLLKNQIDKLENFQRTYKSELDVLQQRISKNQELIENNKKSLLVLRSSYQNIEKKQSLEMSRELLILIEEFTDISYRALKNEINSLEKKDWTDWLTSYFNTIFISRSTEPIEGDHTDAILSRIDDSLKSGKLENAKIEISKLSSETRAFMKEWIGKLDKLIEMEDQINQ